MFIFLCCRQTARVGAASAQRKNHGKWQWRAGRGALLRVCRSRRAKDLICERGHEPWEANFPAAGGDRGNVRTRRRTSARTSACAQRAWQRADAPRAPAPRTTRHTAGREAILIILIRLMLLMLIILIMIQMLILTLIARRAQQILRAGGAGPHSARGERAVRDTNAFTSANG